MMHAFGFLELLDIFGKEKIRSTFVAELNGTKCSPQS